MGETRVDLLHLLEDLRDAYPGAIEETILTEIMANALDSGASIISFACDSADRRLTIIDNGSGMQRRDLARFHNIASSNKIRARARIVQLTMVWISSLKIDHTIPIWGG